MSSANRKHKWTISVKPRLSEKIDMYVESQKKSNANRSLVVEEALELWLAKQGEQEEEAYYAAHAAELNADSKSWSRVTRDAAKHLFK